MKKTINRRSFLKAAGYSMLGAALNACSPGGLLEAQNATSPPAAPQGLPNILLLVMDTVRAKSLSLFGYTRSTSPELERIAQSGVTFTKALATAPWTLPSHASIFTGHFPSQLSANFTTPLDNTYPTLAEVLSARGYDTAGFVANLEYCSYEFGLNRGFHHYEDYGLSPEEIIRSSALEKNLIEKIRQELGNYQILGRKNATHINQGFLSWLSNRKNEKPFFAFLNYFDAHDPYLPPQEFTRRFSTNTPRGYIGDHLEQITSSQILELQESYDASIAYIDQNIGALFDQLNRSGILDNTLLIILADHGEQFGEHNLLLHANSLYLELLHVPFILVFPGRLPSGIKIDTDVSLINLASTITDLVGVEAQLPGVSLAPLIKQTNQNNLASGSLLRSEVERGIGLPYPDWYPTMKGSLVSLYYQDKHFIKNLGSHLEELYDVHNDPMEGNNLIQEPAMKDIGDWFRQNIVL
jgi:arylsulfatase A-like enzyme